MHLSPDQRETGGDPEADQGRARDKGEGAPDQGPLPGKGHVVPNEIEGAIETKGPDVIHAMNQQVRALNTMLILTMMLALTMMLVLNKVDVPVTRPLAVRIEIHSQDAPHGTPVGIAMRPLLQGVHLPRRSRQGDPQKNNPLGVPTDARLP